MANREISDQSEQATQRTNAADVLTPILEVQPRVGTRLTFSNRVPLGVEEGIPIFFKLRQADGSALPANTRLLLTKEEPVDDDSSPISIAEPQIGFWNDTSIIEQQNKDRIDSFKHSLMRDFYEFEDDDLMYVEIDSPAQIDWSQSEFYFKSSAVEEVRERS